MVKLVLFDIDGTLIRTGGAGVKAFARAFATEFGIAEGTEKLKFAGRTDVSLVREFFLLNGIEPSAAHFKRFFAAYVHWLERIIIECESEICFGVEGFMAELRELPEPPVIGLLTGNIQRGAQIKLQHLKLWEVFPFGGFADDHEERDCIAAIAKRRGLERIQYPVADHEVLVIGDTPLDIRCARAIKARVLAVATGSSPVAELQSHKPDIAVEHLGQIRVKDL